MLFKLFKVFISEIWSVFYPRGLAAIYAQLYLESFHLCVCMRPFIGFLLLKCISTWTINIRYSSLL